MSLSADTAKKESPPRARKDETNVQSELLRDINQEIWRTIENAAVFYMLSCSVIMYGWILACLQWNIKAERINTSDAS